MRRIYLKLKSFFSLAGSDVTKIEVANTRKTIPEPTVTVRILPSKANERRQRLLRLFWLRLLAAGLSELKAGSETNGENE